MFYCECGASLHILILASLFHPDSLPANYVRADTSTLPAISPSGCTGLIKLLHVMTMRLEVLTSAFALAGTSLLCDLPFVCLPSLYPGRLCQQHRLMALCVPPLSHISVEHLISAAYRSDDRAQHILGDTQRVPLFTSQVRGCLVQLHPYLSPQFSTFQTAHGSVSGIQHNPRDGHAKLIYTSMYRTTTGMHHLLAFLTSHRLNCTF